MYKVFIFMNFYILIHWMVCIVIKLLYNPFISFQLLKKSLHVWHNTLTMGGVYCNWKCTSPGKTSEYKPHKNASWQGTGIDRKTAHTHTPTLVRNNCISKKHVALNPFCWSGSVYKWSNRWVKQRLNKFVLLSLSDATEYLKQQLRKKNIYSMALTEFDSVMV